MIIKRKSGIQILVWLIIPLLFIKMLYSYMGMPFVELEDSSYGWQQLAKLDSVTLLLKYAVFFIVIFCFFARLKGIPNKTETISLLVILVTGLVWLVIDILEIGTTSVLYSTANSLGYLTVLAFAIGFQEDLFETIAGQFLPFSILLLAISIIEYVSFLSLHPGGMLANSKCLVCFIDSFWLFCIGSVYNLRKKKYPFLFIKIFALFFPILGLLFNSRSWIIQSILWLIIYFYLEQKEKGLKTIFKLLVYSAIILVFLLFIMSQYFPEAYKRLLEKLGNDTRSFQYQQLFEQVSFWDLIIGQGQDFQYYQNGELYSYIDNGYLMVLLRYGIMVGIPYVFAFLIPLLKGWKKRKQLGDGFGYVAVIFLWMLALGGLSIYNMVVIDIKSIVLPIAAGYISRACMKSNNQERLEEQLLKDSL